MISLVWAMVMAILAFGRFVFVTHSGKPFLAYVLQVKIMSWVPTTYLVPLAACVSLVPAFRLSADLRGSPTQKSSAIPFSAVSISANYIPKVFLKSVQGYAEVGSNQIRYSGHNLTSDDIESWENVRESLRLGDQPWAPVKPPGPTNIHNKRIRIPWATW
jgi:hypothetical protein